MDDKSERLAWIIDLIKGDMKLAKSELARLEYEEAPDRLSEEHLANVAENEPTGSRCQYGQVAMTIHYTLGHGVADALGGNLEHAVYRAFHEASAVKKWGQANLEVTFLGVGMLAEFVFDKEEKLAYLHLELGRSQYEIDWDEIEDYLDPPPEEPKLN